MNAECSTGTMVSNSKSVPSTAGMFAAFTHPWIALQLLGDPLLTAFSTLPAWLPVVQRVLGALPVIGAPGEAAFRLSAGTRWHASPTEASGNAAHDTYLR